VYKTQSAKETQQLGYELGQKIKKGGLVLLFGGLGSGKTTFVQGLARGLGIKQRVNSPTFIVARRYDLAGRFFYHVDLYRLTSLEDVRGIGLEEMWIGRNVVVIEWPELVEQIVPKHVKVRFAILGENEREITIKNFEN
jgi:tRNA threonylcarbamoyladenosine biosynthesis protein TsaE